MVNGKWSMVNGKWSMHLRPAGPQNLKPHISSLKSQGHPHSQAEQRNKQENCNEITPELHLFLLFSASTPSENTKKSAIFFGI